MSYQLLLLKEQALKDKEKDIRYRGTRIRIMSDFFSETIVARIHH